MMRILEALIVPISSRNECQVYCGMLDLEENDADGLPCYKALWSHYHCHYGVGRRPRSNPHPPLLSYI